MDDVITQDSLVLMENLGNFDRLKFTCLGEKRDTTYCGVINIWYVLYVKHLM